MCSRVTLRVSIDSRCKAQNHPRSTPRLAEVKARRPHSVVRSRLCRQNRHRQQGSNGVPTKDTLREFCSKQGRGTPTEKGDVWRDDQGAGPPLWEVEVSDDTPHVRTYLGILHEVLRVAQASTRCVRMISMGPERGGGLQA